MDYEKGKFRVYIKKRNGKEVKQVGVTGLSVNSNFEDNDDIILMKETDWDNFQNDYSSQQAKIKDLENELQEVKNELGKLENVTPENPRYYNELLNAKDEKDKLKDIINHNNIVLGNVQNKFFEFLEEVIIQITKEYDTAITEANTQTLTRISDVFDLVDKTYSNVYDYIQDLEDQQDRHNEKVSNSNFVTRAVSKDTFKLDINTRKLEDLDSKLKDINQYSLDYEDLVKPIEIPASKLSEIKLNAKSKKFNISELFIDTANLDDNEDTITITPEEVTNGNDN